MISYNYIIYFISKFDAYFTDLNNLLLEIITPDKAVSLSGSSTELYCRVLNNDNTPTAAYWKQGKWSGHTILIILINSGTRMLRVNI